MIKIQQLHVQSHLLTIKLQMCNRSTHSDVLLSVSVPVNDLQETLHHSTGHQGLHTYRKNTCVSPLKSIKSGHQRLNAKITYHSRSWPSDTGRKTRQWHISVGKASTEGLSKS